MKSFKLRAILILLCTALLICTSVHNAKAGNVELQKLYNELMGFKHDAGFHRVGFGVCCIYNKWKLKVEGLRNRSDLSTTEKIAAGDLLMLGLEYMETKGKENDYTRFAREAITETLE